MTMTVMSMTSIMPMLSMSIYGSAIVSILFLAEIVGFIPCCFNEYLKGWIQMNNKDKKHQTNKSKYSKKKHFDAHDSKKCYDTWYNKGENKKNNRYNDGSEIE